MKQFKSILLLKLPFCTHPDAVNESASFRTKAPFRPIPSLALASLCAFIDKYKTFDYKIKAIDINIEAYTEPEVSINTGVYMDLLTDAIKNNDYDVLSLSAMFVFNVKWVDTAIKLSKKFHPEAKIILGGGYPTIFPERCLEKHDIDEVVIGEGEATYLHILNRYNSHVDVEFEKKFLFEGYSSKNEKGNILICKERHHFIDLDYLPVPAWHYLKVDRYFAKSGDRTLPVEASRGCPYSCSYCCTYLSWGRKLRYKPVEKLINEITEIKRNHDVEVLHFVDDNLSFDKTWLRNLLERLISMRLPLKFTASNFSSKHLDEEIIDLLFKAGMDKFGIGVESGSLEIQRRINKNLDFRKVKEIVNIIKSRNLYVHLCWMVGFPNETIEQISETFSLARELRAHSNQFLTVLPYPGTRLFKEAEKADLLVFQEDDLDKFDNRKCDYIKSDEWTYDKLQEMIYDVNIELNFLNNVLLDNSKGMDYMLQFLEKLILRLSEHIIARIVIGYIYKQRNDLSKCKEYYQSAANLFRKKTLYDIFSKYLSWRHLIIDDFNQYLKTEGIYIK